MKVRLTLLAGTALLVGFLATLRSRFLVVTVVGHSMEPTLADGDRVLVRRAALDRVRPADLVVVHSPHRSADHPSLMTAFLVKRLAAVTGRQLRVLGDNPSKSFDSRHFGSLGERALVGVVVRRL